MVTECGMSEEIGPVFVENTESPDMRRRIDGEIARILREAYGRVKALLVSSFTAIKFEGGRPCVGQRCRAHRKMQRVICEAS